MKLRYRTTWLVIGWSLVGLVWYLSLTAHPPGLGLKLWDKLNHFIAYAGLMGWFGQLYQGKPIRLAYAAGFIIMGISIEFLQGMSTERLFEYEDMLANTLGVLLAMMVIHLQGDRLLAWFEHRILRVS